MEPLQIAPASPKSPKTASPASSPSSGGSGAHLSRKNKPQRCSICKECGHKSRTCRFAQGSKGAPPSCTPPADQPHPSRPASGLPRRRAHSSANASVLGRRRNEGIAVDAFQQGSVSTRRLGHLAPQYVPPPSSLSHSTRRIKRHSPGAAGRWLDALHKSPLLGPVAFDLMRRGYSPWPHCLPQCLHGCRCWRICICRALWRASPHVHACFALCCLFVP